MRLPTIAAVPLLVTCPVLAQEPAGTERLLRIIEQQQRQLDAQEAQLAEQRKALTDLRRDVEALRASAGTRSQVASARTVPVTPPLSPDARRRAEARKDAGTAGSTGSSKGSPGLREAIGETPNDWPESFGVPGTDTRMQISGFVELDAIYDTSAITTPSAFVTQAIVTGDGTSAEGSDGQSNLSVQPTRLSVETRTPWGERRLRTFASMDWFDNFATTTPAFRLREAYGEVSNLVFGGDLLLGQTWSTYSNLYAAPNVLDFQGPNALFGVRHPMLRWTRDLAADFTLKLAAEAADERVFEGANPLSRWPDAVIALGWQTDQVNIQGNLLGRDLRASAGNRTLETFGWGASLQGRLQMPRTLSQDFATFSLTYGEGIGGLINDAPPDAVFNPASNTLGAIPTLAWFGSYQHWWSPEHYTVLSYGEVRQDTLAIQGPSAYEMARYASANLTWTPVPQWLFGVELLFGSREDRDGAKGSDVRTQLTSRFIFP